MKWLAFIDTNIFLDFYRESGAEGTQQQLEFIDQHRSEIITTSLIQMEFMKNRQKILSDTLSRMPGSIQSAGHLPPILRGGASARRIRDTQKLLESQRKRAQARVEKILLNPSSNDPVYQCVQRLAKHTSATNMARDKNIRFKIRTLARKRWTLGYPPRKTSDTSIGDAVNWEWIIHCAEEQKANVMIVSRDGDYGLSHGGKAYINDWLQQEFKARVNFRRKIELSQKLTDAMKVLRAPVSPSIKRAEAALLGESEGGQLLLE